MGRRNKKVPEIDRGILASISAINIDTPPEVFDMVFWVGWNAAIMGAARDSIAECKYDSALTTMDYAVSMETETDTAEKAAEDAKGER